MQGEFEREKKNNNNIKRFHRKKIAFKLCFIINFVFMNPYNFPQCYISSSPYFFTSIPQEQPQNLIPVVQQLKNQLQALKNENAHLKERIAELEVYQEEAQRREESISQVQRGSNAHSRQQSRRRKKTVESKFTCPYQNCKRFYGSTLALNLHIKLKHNGGTKKERQTYAKIILSCEQKGEEPPKFDCNFPPGFLEQQRKLRNPANTLKKD